MKKANANQKQEVTHNKSLKREINEKKNSNICKTIR